MKSLAIEDDVSGWLFDRVAESGESVSAFLRRRLGIEPTHSAAAPVVPRASAPPPSPLEDLFQSTEFRCARGVVGRFIALLAWLHRTHPNQFHKVEAIKGRERVYFAKSADVLEASGSSVSPKPIPGSDYWVITTSPTDLKQQMIRALMFALGYRGEDTRRAEAEIAGSVHYHLELWHVDGTILAQHDGTEPFPKWQMGERVHVKMINRTAEVREILDSSSEEGGTVYFRRIVRVAEIH